MYVLAGDCNDLEDQLKRQAKLIKQLHVQSAVKNVTSGSSTSHQQLVVIDRIKDQAKSNLPVIYMITPTYARWTQKADLTRLCQTLMHVRRLHWIVVEDSDTKSRLVTHLLSGNNTCKVVNTHLNVRTRPDLRLAPNDPNWRKNRGVEQRNLAIDWLRTMAAERKLPGMEEGGTGGVVYFGDDDNTYDLAVFDEVYCYNLYTQKCHSGQDSLPMW